MMHERDSSDWAEFHKFHNAEEAYKIKKEKTLKQLGKSKEDCS